MATCKHCGAAIPDGAAVCPDCGQQNTEQVDESYLDNLLNTISSEPETEERADLFWKKKKKEKVVEKKEEKKEPEHRDFFSNEFMDTDGPDLDGYNILDPFGEEDEKDIDAMISRELQSSESQMEEDDPEDIASFPWETEGNTEEEMPMDMSSADMLLNMDFPGGESDDSTFPGGDGSADDALAELLGGGFSSEESPAEENPAEENPAEESPAEGNSLDENVLEEMPGQEAPSLDELLGTAETQTEPSLDELLGASGAGEASSLDGVFGTSDGGEASPLDELFASSNQPEEEAGTTASGGSSSGDEGIGLLDEQLAGAGDVLSRDDIDALNDLLQSFGNDGSDSDDGEESAEEDSEEIDDGLSELLSVGDDEDGEGGKSGKRKSKKKKEKKKKSILKKVFGNLPVDPSKRKPEPTPEEIAAKKQAKAEAKKQAAETKKAEAAAKKEAAQKAKEERAHQKELEKEAKKAKKLEEAKLILEEMEETRINPKGAAIIFAAFALIAAVIILGSQWSDYAIHVKAAENSFNKALNNDPKYYTEAYEEIYGLDLKGEDKELGDKIYTVNFLNKQLNSYNSYIVMKNDAAALDSLFKGLLRYEEYIEFAAVHDFADDMEYIRNIILAELNSKYGVPWTEAQRIADIMYEIAHGTTDGREPATPLDYSREIYAILK